MTTGEHTSGLHHHSHFSDSADTSCSKTLVIVIGWLKGRAASRPPSGPITSMSSVAGQDAVNYGDQDGDQTGNQPVSPSAARKSSS